MHLPDIFRDAASHGDNLVQLYKALASSNTRAARAPWKAKLFQYHIVRWPQAQDIWRSTGSNILVIGNRQSTLAQSSFTPDNLKYLLRSAFVLYLSAVDKILHDAVMRRFANLARGGNLDDLIRLSISESYHVAIQSRTRRGAGGRIRRRPSHFFKDFLMSKLYRISFLSSQKVEEVSSACGLPRVFTEFVIVHPRYGRAGQVKTKWSSIYERRNHIAHECDIIRKEAARRVDYNRFDPATILLEMEIVKVFGTFLAEHLDT